MKSDGFSKTNEGFAGAFNKFLDVVRKPPILKSSAVIVGDDVAFLDLMERYLTGRGFEAVIFSKPSALMDRIQSLKPALVVLECSLCGGSLRTTLNAWDKLILTQNRDRPDSRNQIPVLLYCWNPEGCSEFPPTENFVHAGCLRKTLNFPRLAEAADIALKRFTSPVPSK